MSDEPEVLPWSIVRWLRPAVAREELSLAAKLDCAVVTLLLVEDALTNGIRHVGLKRKWKVSIRDEIVLTAVRQALGLIK